MKLSHAILIVLITFSLCSNPRFGNRMGQSLASFSLFGLLSKQNTVALKANLQRKLVSNLYSDIIGGDSFFSEFNPDIDTRCENVFKKNNRIEDTKSNKNLKTDQIEKAATCLEKVLNENSTAVGKILNEVKSTIKIDSKSNKKELLARFDSIAKKYDPENKVTNQIYECVMSPVLACSRKAKAKGFK